MNACEGINMRDVGLKEIKLFNDDSVTLNYIHCGKIFFDGIFKVITFPKNTILYHGSNSLSDSNKEYPNFYYYDSKNYKNVNNINVENNFTDQHSFNAENHVTLTPTWYSNYNTAKLYSDTIHVYKITNENTKFIILDDHFNLFYILKKMKSKDEMKLRLQQMYGVSDDDFKIGTSPYMFNVTVNNLYRTSYRDIDMTFTKYFCEIINKNYAGYVSNEQYVIDNNKLTKIFHLEFIFCNVYKYLSRDIFDENDCQYFKLDKLEKYTKMYINTLLCYVTTNVFFHGGNLFEHSIWALLYAEKYIEEEDMFKMLKPDKRLVCIIAFLHDIGKIQKTNKKKNNKYYYHTHENHPFVGAEYITNDKYRNLLVELGVHKYQNLISHIIKNHMYIGTVYMNYKAEKFTLTKKIKNEILMKNYTSKEINILLFIYLCDVSAMQSFPNINNVNAKSTIIPGISNVPQKYPGIQLDLKSIKKFITLIQDISVVNVPMEIVG
jgi:hypothetical protein